MKITTVGIDLAKALFQVHGVDERGKAVLRKQLKRKEVVRFFANFAPCLIGMEACGTSHYWARELIRLGHEVRLMPPAYVKPYVKRGKTDAGDAEAICEAVTRPTMRFVPVKSAEQQAALALHRTRDLLVKQRTQLVNMVRGLLAEFGIEMARGLHHALALAARLAAGEVPEVPSLAQRIVVGLARQIGDLQDRLTAIERELLAWHRSNELSQRLATIPGIGVISATALAASVIPAPGMTGSPSQLGPTIRRFAGPDAACQLQRRQGTIGQDLAHGRSLSAPAAGGRHDLARSAGKDKA